MNYKEFYDKIVSGEVSLPLVVQVVNPPWDEFELDKGCKAELVSINHSKGNDPLFKIVLDFSQFVEFNKQFWTADWRKGDDLVPYHETHYFKESNGKCDVTVDWYDKFGFSYSTDDEKMMVSKEEYEKLKNFYEKNKNNY